MFDLELSLFMLNVCNSMFDLELSLFMLNICNSIIRYFDCIHVLNEFL